MASQDKTSGKEADKPEKVGDTGKNKYHRLIGEFRRDVLEYLALIGVPEPLSVVKMLEKPAGSLTREDGAECRKVIVMAELYEAEKLANNIFDDMKANNGL